MKQNDVYIRILCADNCRQQTLFIGSKEKSMQIDGRVPSSQNWSKVRLEIWHIVPTIKAILQASVSAFMGKQRQAALGVFDH